MNNNNSEGNFGWVGCHLEHHTWKFNEFLITFNLLQQVAGLEIAIKLIGNVPKLGKRHLMIIALAGL